MRKLFEIGGFAATAVLVVFGVVAITMGVNGRSTVHNSLALEQIVGTPDMNATAIAAEAKKAGLAASIVLGTWRSSRSSRSARYDTGERSTRLCTSSLRSPFRIPRSRASSPSRSISSITHARPLLPLSITP